MNTQQIEELLGRLVNPARANFLGVFARDLTPEIKDIDEYPACFVANSDVSNKPGEHWLAFYYASPHSYEFFDSYGATPFVYGFRNSKLPRRNTRSNSIQFQCLKSNVCGPYCIYYLYKRCLGIPMSKAFAHFSPSNVNANDHFVQRFVNEIAPRPIAFRFCKPNTSRTFKQGSVSRHEFIRINK